MAAKSEFPLSLIIKAVDNATAPLRAVNKRIQEITAPVRKLNNSMRAFADEAGIPRLVQGFKGVGTAVGKVGHEAWALGKHLALMAATAGFALYRIVKGAVDAGDKLEEMSKRVGLSVDAYAQLQFAAAQADVEQESFNGAMDQFNKRLGMAKAGTGPMLAFLAKVSPALAKQVKGSKSTEEAIGLVTSAFEKVTDPGKRAALAAALFGKSGLQMGQFLGQGTKAIEEQRKKYFELTGSQEAFAKGASDLDNTIRETEMAFGGLRNAAMAGLFPAFRELSQELTRFLVANREGITKWAKETGAAIMAWVKGGGLTRLGESLKSIADTVGKVIDKIGGIKGVAVVAGAILGGPFLLSILSLGKALFVLGAAALPVAISGFTLFTAGAASAGFAALSFMATVVPALGAAAAAVGSFMVAAAPFAIAALAVGAAGYAIYKNWSALGEMFTTVTGALNGLKTMVNLIISPLESLKVAGQWWGKELGITGGAKPAPTLGAAAAIAQPGQSKTEAHVTVDFVSLPRGAKVTQDSSNSAPLDLNYGFSMIGP